MYPSRRLWLGAGGNALIATAPIFNPSPSVGFSSVDITGLDFSQALGSNYREELQESLGGVAMKVAISATRPSLEAPVDSRFGKSRYLIFLDSETMEFEAVENPNLMSLTDSGGQMARLVANEGAQLLLTGQCGPQAREVLSKAGIQVFTEVKGTVEEAAEKYAWKRKPPPISVASRVAAGGQPATPLEPATMSDLTEVINWLQTLDRRVSEIQGRLEELERRSKWW
jgi:predicted Fe-Mo cluster-binding NifX family protein